MAQTNPTYQTDQPQSMVSREDQVPTIGAKPIQPERVVGPIRRRFRSYQAVWYILGVIEALLFFNFFLKLIGANASAGFTQFIYAVSFPFASPFSNVITSSRQANSTFDWSLLLAMVFYSLVAWGLVKLLVMSKPISDTEADQKLGSQE